MFEPLVVVTGMLCDGEALGSWLEVTAFHRPVTVVRPSFESIDVAVDHVLGVSAEPISLIGFSLGGVVALACAIRAPARIARLGLVATNPFPPRQEQRQQWHQWRASCRAGGFETVAAEATRAMVPGLNPETNRRAMAMAWRVGPLEFDRQLSLQSSRSRLELDLGAVTADTTVLGGCDDPLCPPRYETHLARGIAGARLLILEECGHLCFWDRPSQTTQALDDLLGSGGQPVV